RGAAATDPRSGMGLWFVTEAEVNRGSYCPVKISDVDGLNTVTTMGRVLESNRGEHGTEVIMTLPREDEKLVKALGTWFPLPALPEPAPAALGLTASAPVAASPSASNVPNRPAAPSAPLPEGLGEMAPSAEDELDLTDLAETLSTGQKSAVNNEVVRFQYETLIGEADKLEKQNNFAEAFKKVEKALSIYPIYADDLHVRLAKLAQSNNQIGLALKHAETAQQLNPSRRDAGHLIRQINTQRSTRANAEAEKTKKRGRRNELRNTVGSVLLFALVIAPSVGYNIWAYAIPHGPQPEVLSLDSFSDLIGADKAMFANGVVYFFVSQGWEEMDKEAKEEKMTELVSRAKRLLDAQRVVITNAEPRLLATANNDRIKVYR
ncbi:MAG: tetratricopeptide repeat protein, partial [Myxococcota bacterium]